MTSDTGWQHDLEDGEEVLAHWRPALVPFLKGFVLAGFLTSLLLGPFIWREGVLVLVASILAGMLLWGFIFDDWQAWRQRRGDHWLLTNRRLLFSNDQGFDAPAAIGLDEIAGFSRLAWLGLTLRLKNGMRLRMSYLPDPRAVRGRVENAMERRA